MDVLGFVKFYKNGGDYCPLNCIKSTENFYGSIIETLLLPLVKK